MWTTLLAVTNCNFFIHMVFKINNYIPASLITNKQNSTASSFFFYARSASYFKANNWENTNIKNK